MVEFVSITTDPANDTPDVLSHYAEAHGADRGNWRFLTIAPNQDEDATRALAEEFGHTFDKGEDGYQTHSTVTHIIDSDGRWAANFHGLRFAPVNLVLYVNGLINNAHAPAKAPERSWWQRLKALL